MLCFVISILPRRWRGLDQAPSGAFFMGLTMIYFKWALYIVPSFFMAIFGRIIAPILPFFVQDDGYLPKWLWWFQTPDNPCDGDRGHLERWPSNTPWGIYCRRVAWFLRNVAYGFDDSVLGVKMIPSDHLETVGNTNASDTNGISGTCWRKLFRDGELIAFHYYFIKHYRIWRFTACVRISLGWKLWNPETYDKQFTCYFHPFKSIQIIKGDQK